jgi:hypothetical protein
MKQGVFQLGAMFFLVNVWEDGTITLKVKENGWSDTWSLPVAEVHP